MKFDGYDGQRLVDAKDHYEQFARSGKFQDWWENGKRALRDQAERQIKAAGDTKMEWWVSNKESADAIRRHLARNDIDGIKVIHKP